MFNSTMLETGIGLVFVFLLISLVCTAAKEVLESRLRMRARSLELGLQEMLSDYVDHKSKASKVSPTPERYTDGVKRNLVEDFYNHPLICCLYRGKYDSNNLRQLPAYIPSRSFALAMLDLVKPAEQKINESAVMSGAAGATPSTLLVAAAGPSMLMPFIVMPAPEGKPATITPTPEVAPAPASSNDLKPLRDAVGLIENTQVKKALLAMIDAAGGDIQQVRQNLEAWFDSSMDRVSGWYKRHTQNCILAIAFVVTVALNVDTLAIARALQNDKLRQQVVAAAEIRGITPPGKLQADSEKWQEFKKANAALTATGIPLGWDLDDFQSFPRLGNQPKYLEKKPDEYSINEIAYVFSAWVMKIFGLLITALAASLGAPFWFDILNQFMVLRSTVKPQEKSKNEASKDPTRQK